MESHGLGQWAWGVLGGGGHGLITTRVFSLSCCFLCVAAVSSGLLGRCGRGLVALIQWKGGP